MTAPQTPAPPRAPVADTDDALATVRSLRRAGYDALAFEINALIADLDATRAERDAAQAALPDPMELEGIAGLRAGTSKMLVKMDQDALFAMAARIRALDAATVPAADVPPFLAHRVNGGVR